MKKERALRKPNKVSFCLKESDEVFVSVGVLVSVNVFVFVEV
jgi:hypothetical protein